jgi:hypothetical protein
MQGPGVTLLALRLLARASEGRGPFLVTNQRTCFIALYPTDRTLSLLGLLSAEQQEQTQGTSGDRKGN